MFRRRGRAPVSGDKVEDRAKLLVHSVLCRKIFPFGQWDPCPYAELPLAHAFSILIANVHTLIFPIPPLHLLMHPLLHLPLQNPRSRRLVIVSHFQDVRRVDPVVGAAAHDMVAVGVVFVDRDLALDQYM